MNLLIMRWTLKWAVSFILVFGANFMLQHQGITQWWAQVLLDLPLMFAYWYLVDGERPKDTDARDRAAPK